MTDYDHDQRGASRWHLDKRVPIAFIAAILFQTFTFGWIASSFNARVESIERYIEDAKISTATAVVLERDRGDRLVRLETMMGEIHRTMMNIERKMEGAAHRTPPQR